MRLTVRDVAGLLNVSEKSIYRWISTKEIPFYRVKEQYRFSKAEVIEWATRARLEIPAEVLSEKPEDIAHPLKGLSDSLEVGGIFYRVGGSNKDLVLKAVVDLLKLPDEVDRAFLHKILLAREALGSTGLGDGIAVPHVRNPIVLAVDKPSVTLCFLENKIEFGAMDGKPVNTLFTIISPTVKGHLHLLSRLAFALKDKGFKSAITREASRDDIIREAKRVEKGLERA